MLEKWVEPAVNVWTLAGQGVGGKEETELEQFLCGTQKRKTE